MYSVKCDEYYLYDYRDPELILENPQITVEVNSIGSGSFAIYNNHPYFNHLRKMKSVFEVRDEIGVVFRGRMTDDSTDFDNVKDVELEGVLAYFNDSIVRPYSFPGDFLEDADYISASESGNVVGFFLKWFIDNHNSQVQPFQQFKLGKVTVSDPNNYITRSNNKHTKSWAEIKSKLFDSALGGYLCIRYEDDGNYIDYLSKFELTNTQEIVFGENLLDLKRKSDASGIFTAMIPIGAEVETESTDGSNKTKVTVTIEGIADGEIDDDIVKSGDTIYSKSAVEQYGWIYANIDTSTWKDITLAENLLTTAVAQFKQESVLFNESIDLTAVDLHFTDAEIRSFRIYRNVSVNSLPHGQSGLFPLTKLTIPLLQPQNTKITVGGKSKTFTDKNHDKFQSTEQRIESTKNELKDDISSVENQTNETTDEIRQIIIEQNTSLTNTCEAIIFEAMKSYTETGDFNSFKETVESQLKILSEEISLKFTETNSSIENVNGDLQEKWNQISTYFSFTINGFTIGKSDSPCKLFMDNDEISMQIYGIEVLWFKISENSQEANIPEINCTKQFKLLGCLIDRDEDGNVNCEYVGGAS